MVSTGQAISHYEIRRRLGQGGMCEIYRAKDLTLGRDIAIKVLPEKFSLDRRNEVPFSTMETPSTGSQLAARGESTMGLLYFHHGLLGQAINNIRFTTTSS